MKILAGRWTAEGWVVALDGPGTERLAVGDRVVIPFVARPEEFWASMVVIANGHFPVCRLADKHDAVSAQALIGESVLRHDG
jgi:hypothetical protein